MDNFPSQQKCLFNYHNLILIEHFNQIQFQNLQPTKVKVSMKEHATLKQYWEMVVDVLHIANNKGFKNISLIKT